jgi:hypothetical protein
MHEIFDEHSAPPFGQQCAALVRFRVSFSVSSIVPYSAILKYFLLHLSFSGHQPEGAAQQLLLESFRGYRRWSCEPPFDDLLQRADDKLGEKFGISG